jgi:long-chain acyl-CoA synthetase
VVNTNPLYTAREMEHQFNDSGAKALVCLANMAHLAETVVPKTGVKHVIVTEVADLLPPLKRLLINSVIKYVKKMVPAYHLPKAVKFNDVLSKGMASQWPKPARPAATWRCCNTPAAPPAWPRARC